jgi:hypothetical protein
MNAQDRAAIAASTNRIIESQIGTGGKTTPWITALRTTFDSSKAADKALIVETSAITGIFSEDIRFRQATLLLENAGIQGRVLIDCSWPTCNPASDSVPLKNLAAPGVITLDQAFHFLLNTDSVSLNAALDATAGARSFNFFKVGIGKSPQNDHTVQFQVRLMVSSSDVGGLNGVLAGIGKRTMIVEAVKLDLDEE